MRSSGGAVGRGRGRPGGRRRGREAGLAGAVGPSGVRRTAAAGTRRTSRPRRKGWSKQKSEAAGNHSLARQGPGAEQKARVLQLSVRGWLEFVGGPSAVGNNDETSRGVAEIEISFAGSRGTCPLPQWKADVQKLLCQRRGCPSIRHRVSGSRTAQLCLTAKVSDVPKESGRKTMFWRSMMSVERPGQARLAPRASPAVRADEAGGAGRGCRLGVRRRCVLVGRAAAARGGGAARRRGRRRAPARCALLHWLWR